MKRLLAAGLLLFPFAATAQTITLRWDAYPQPAGHRIEAQCKLDAGDYTPAGDVPADKTSISVDRAVEPGQSIA